MVASLQEDLAEQPTTTAIATAAVATIAIAAIATPVATIA